MSVNHRHPLKIPVNEMSNTHRTKPQPRGPAEESSHLPAEPSPLSPDSTIHIYGKGGERKEYIFRGLYNSSFAHRSLSFPSPPSPGDGSYFLHPHTAVPPPFPTKEKGSARRTHPETRAREDPANHTPLPASPGAATRHDHLLTSLTLSTRPTGEHQRSTIPLYLEPLYYLNYSILSILLYALAQSHPKRL